MEITEKNIKMWSIIGPRATVGLAALDLAKNIKNLMVLTCDVSTSAGLDRYRKTFPTCEAPAFSRSLNLVKERLIPIAVTIIMVQPWFD